MNGSWRDRNVSFGEDKSGASEEKRGDKEDERGGRMNRTLLLLALHSLGILLFLDLLFLRLGRHAAEAHGLGRALAPPSLERVKFLPINTSQRALGANPKMAQDSQGRAHDAAQTCTFVVSHHHGRKTSKDRNAWLRPSWLLSKCLRTRATRTKSLGARKTSSAKNQRISKKSE